MKTKTDRFGVAMPMTVMNPRTVRNPIVVSEMELE
jgi:hypothetical protein